MVTVLTNNSEPKSNCVWPKIRYNLTSTATRQLTYTKLCHLRPGACNHSATDTIVQILRTDPSNSCAAVLIVLHCIFGVQRWNKKFKVVSVWSCHFSHPSYWTESAQTPSTCQLLWKVPKNPLWSRCFGVSTRHMLNSPSLLPASSKKQVRDSWWRQPSLPHRHCRCFKYKFVKLIHHSMHNILLNV